MCILYAPPPPPPPPPSSHPPARLRARVSYLGTNYHGWQYQLHHSTIQSVLEDALSTRLQHPIRATAASRTDAGVHARGQAVHFDLPTSRSISIQPFQHSVNQLLPPDVRLYSTSHAPVVPNSQHAWSAIYAARGKLYTYRFSIARVFDPLERPIRHHEWRAARTFHFDRLVKAAALFQGCHDFSAFTNTAAMPKGIIAPVLINPVRNIRSVRVVDECDGSFRIEFQLDGALYRMVRNIVGVLLDIAVGKRDVEFVHHLFEMRDRRLAGKSAPPEGLCLEKVYYDDW